MSEEQESGMSTIKKTIIGIATTAITGAGVYVTTNINKILGIEEEEPKTEQVEAAPAAAPVVVNLTNNNSQQQNNSGGGGTTIIRETVKEVPAQPVAQPAAPIEAKKETTAERIARLKAEKEQAGK